MFSEFSRGDLVWFDPGIGYVLPGEVLEYHKTAQVQTSTVYGYILNYLFKAGVNTKKQFGKQSLPFWKETPL